MVCIERAGTDALTIVPTEKIVKDVIEVLKEVENNADPQNEAIINSIIKARNSLESGHEAFMDLFVENHGIYEL